MKLLLLSDAASIHTKRWVTALSERGIEILLFSLNNHGNEFYDNLKNVKLRALSHNVRGKLTSKIKYLTTIGALNKIIADFKPDIIHAHYASSYGLLGALSKKQCPYIISVWGSDVYDFPHIMPFGKRILRYNFRKADYILSTSRVMAQETRKYTDKPIEITPFGVDTEHFKPLACAQSSDFVVGIVKTLTPKYGIDVLIKAFKLVCDNNRHQKLRLEIYGRGEYQEEYEQLAKSLSLNDKVTFHGFIDNSKLPEVYNKFSVSVSVSVSNSESFGVVAVEAMSCGCPVVTSDADGFTEVVNNGVTGFIVPKRDVKATADAIQKFIDNPTLRKTMGAAGRQRVLDLFDWNDNVNSMTSIYNNILNQK